MMKKSTFKSLALSMLFLFASGLAMSQTVNTAITAQTDTFTVTFDVTPSVAPLNGGVGLSQGDVAGWGDMSPIVGFTPEGIIRTRNGAAYQQMEVMTYEAGKAYHVVMTLDVPSNKYSATITPDGGAEVVMAYDFGFRAAADSINTYFTHNDSNVVWGGVPGALLDISNFAILDSVVDINYGIQVGTFQNVPIAAQKGRFVAEYNIVASHDSMNSGFAFSGDTAQAWSDLSPIIRFGTTGLIDVRDGGTYTALSEYKYYKDKVYKFKMEVDVFTNTYNVAVTGDDNKTVVLAEGYGFRKMVEALNYRVVQVDTNTVWGGIPGSQLTVSNFNINFSPAATKIYKTDENPVIDGDLSDGFWDNVEPNYCKNNMSKAVASDADLSGYWKAVWTEGSLYVMANVTDDILFDNGAPTYNTDGVHLYWGLLNNRNGLGGNATTTSTPPDSAKVFGQYYFAADSSDASGGEIGSWLPDVTHKIVVNDTGYVFEASYTWASINKFGIDFAANEGTKILFDLNIVDSDNDGWWREMQWSSAQNNWASMMDAGELELAVMLDFSELSSVIDSSKAVVDTATIGSDAGKYAQETVDAANAAIATAEEALAGASSQEEIDVATAELRAAMELFVPIMVSVNDLLDASFTMYPNPVTDVLTLKNISNVSAISVYSMSGALIRSIENSNVSATIYVSDLKPGLYLLRLNTEEGIAAKRFIKK